MENPFADAHTPNTGDLGLDLEADFDLEASADFDVELDLSGLLEFGFGTGPDGAGDAPSGLGDPAADEPLTGPLGQGRWLVGPDDCISSIARRTGHVAATIWDHPANAELRAHRNPNVLLPGDRVFIPERAPKTEAAATGTGHRFVRRGGRTMFRLRFVRNGGPWAAAPFTLDVHGEVIDGQTDCTGQLVCSIPPDAVDGILRVGEPEDRIDYRLNFGRLHPVDHILGVQQRLNNLNFAAGAIDGVLGPITQSALERFQRRCGLDVRGEPDAATRKALLHLHGS